MSNKRYYWLKLNENFFEDDTIEWIEEQENGERYVLFYLKLCLKSLKEEGSLIRYVGEKLIPYDVKSLAKLTNTDQDTVAVSLKVFEDIGLIERTDAGEIYMKQIDEMIGTETDSARRMRKTRARKNSLPSHCANNVLESDTSVQKSDTEIEIEKELEIEREREEEEKDKEKSSSRRSGSEVDEDVSLIAKEYEKCGFGTIDMRTKELIEDLLEQFSTEWIVQAFGVCVEANKRTLKYAKGILNNWKTEGGMKLGGRKDGEGSRESDSEIEEEYGNIKGATYL